MSERLGALDASFLYLESPTTAMHVGGVATFAVPAGGSDYYPRLIRRIGDRIGAAPRYRQKLCWVPGGLANPIWAFVRLRALAFAEGQPLSEIARSVVARELRL